MEKGSYYQVVRKLIVSRIETGEYEPGDKLPSERSLSSELSLNRNTVRHALLILQREGKIFRLERKGWYVSPIRLIYNPANHINFSRLAASQGMSAHWTTEDHGIIDPTERLEIDGEEFAAETRVYEMSNTYYLNSQKVAYTVTYLDAARLPDIVPKTVSRALTQVVEEEYGYALHQRNLLIRPLLLPKDITTILNISHGSPGIYVRRTKTDGAHAVLTVEHEYWRFDAIEMRVDTAS